MNIHADYIVCINGCPKVPLAIKWSSVDVASHGLKRRVEIERPNLCELFEKFSQKSGSMIESKIQILMTCMKLFYALNLFQHVLEFSMLEAKGRRPGDEISYAFYETRTYLNNKNKTYFVQNKIDRIISLNVCLKSLII